MLQNITALIVPTVASSDLGLYLMPIERSVWERRRTAEQRAVHESLTELYSESVRLAHHPSGAPYLVGCPNEHISISHSERWLLLATDSRPIGVDIEELGEQVQRVRSRFVSDSDERLIHSNCEHLVLHLLWSAKEAAYKLINPTDASLLGFRLTAIELLIEEHRGQLRLEHRELDTDIIIYLYWTELYVIALAQT